MSHGRVTKLFLQARELPATERSAFLDRACEDDASLRADLETLLSHDDQFTGSSASTEAQLTTPGRPYASPRFLPGTVVGDRYRIVAPLGCGGMGEVYRADDLTLGQPVALKFLHRSLADDPAIRDRMLNEVRLSRQIAHPNICRVYDVGEADGQHFFSMEYVDGEDLRSLLRRIGRLPRDRAVQIARQIVAGLAAAHEHEILHRDLKPANIMIDGRGRPKIMDFGIAAVAGELTDREIGLGTPAYMAPEQLAGRAVNVRSDLYSLGLVLYELFTGRPAFAGTTLTDLRLARERSTPLSPSHLVEGFDPAVEEVILACVAPEPCDRPVSALAVLAALPGADPLSAALAAGETPSPDLVAAAESETGMSATVGVALFVAAALGILLLAAVSRRAVVFGRVPLELPPEALAYEARRLLSELSGSGTSGDSAWGFGIDAKTLSHLERTAGFPDSSRFSPVYFWYRSSLTPLRTADGRVNLANPPAVESGMASVILSTEGRLLELHVVPGRNGSPGAPAWEAAFHRAGLDPESFQEDSVHGLPPVHSDVRREWSEGSALAGAGPAKVRAGAVGDTLTYFCLIPYWRNSLLAQPPPARQHMWSFSNVYDGLYIAVLLACVIAARRNLLVGRSDKRGAGRLAVYVFLVIVAFGLLKAHHVPDLRAEREILMHVLGAALFSAAFLCWFPYVALEPALRHSWPHRIVSWTRLLSGRLRDPLVGRDLLIGVTTAVVTQLLLRGCVLVPDWLDLPPMRPDEFWPETLLGFRYSLGAFFRLQPNAVFFGLGLLFLLLGLRTLTRRLWIAVPLLVLLATLAWHPEISSIYPALGMSVTAVRIGIFLIVMLRFGVLAGIVALFFDSVLMVFPLTLNVAAWYSRATLFAVLAALATCAWGLHHALARGSSTIGKRFRTGPG